MDEIAKLDLRKAGVTLKQYVLGRRYSKIDTGTLNVGRYLALDKSTSSNVYLDALRPHVILICGKRGYGKSYTMGTLVEELDSLSPEVKNNIASLVIDTMGIFWTIRHENKKEISLLSKWGLSARGYDADVFVPSGRINQYKDLHIEVKPFSISVSELTGYDWCSLFKIDPLGDLGVILIKIIEDLKEKNSTFTLQKIINYMSENQTIDKNIIHAANNYFRIAQSWGIFDEKG